MKIEVITKEKLADFEHLMLSYIYEELESYDDDLDCEYICLAATVPNEDGIIIPVSVLICLMEPFGDVAVLSVYTLPAYRRLGYASELLDKAVFVARQLFIFEEGEDEEDINVKAIYRLRPEFQEVFEAFLKKNHFVDFILLDEDDDPQVWAAMAEYRFYKVPDPNAPKAEENEAGTDTDAPEASEEAEGADPNDAETGEESSGTDENAPEPSEEGNSADTDDPEPEAEGGSADPQ